MKINIISFDGGGSRVVLPATLVKGVLSQKPELFTNATLIAGTSAGSMLAGVFGTAETPEQAIDRILLSADRVRRGEIFGEPRGALWRAWYAKYSDDYLNKHLNDLFGNSKLQDCIKDVVLPSINMNKPRSFKCALFYAPDGEFSTNLKEDHQDRILSDVVRSSCAAPTFFSAGPYGVDGGIIANNPSLCAIVLAIKQYGCELDDIRLISFGTGAYTKHTEKQHGHEKGGLRYWLPSVLPIVLSTGQNMVDYQCRQLLGDRYLRVNPEVNNTMPIDEQDPAVLDNIIELAGHYKLDHVYRWLKHNWR